MIQTVKAYRARNGQVYSDKMSAQVAEFKLDIQSFCNRHGGNGVTTKNEFHPQQFAEMVSAHTAEFTGIVSSHTRAVNRINRSNKQALLNPATVAIKV